MFKTKKNLPITMRTKWICHVECFNSSHFDVARAGKAAETMCARQHVQKPITTRKNWKNKKNREKKNNKQTTTNEQK